MQNGRIVFSAYSRLPVIAFPAAPALRPPAVASEIISGGFLERRFGMIMSDRPARTIQRGTQAVVLLCALVLLPLGVVYAEDPGYEAVGNRLIEAVRAGELAPEEAVAMMGELARSRFARRLGEELGRHGGPDAHEERRRAEFHEIERRIHEAVAAGKLSPEDARRKREAAEREMFGRDPGHEDERMARLHHAEQRIRAAVESGDLSKEDARRKLAAIKGELFGGRERGHEDERKAKYHEIEKKIHAAVKAGKMSKEDAGRKLEALRREMFGGEERRGEKREDERAARYREIERDIYAAVKAGKLSKEEARRKLADVKRDLFGGDERRGEHKERGREDERVAKYRAIEKEIYAAVKAGKLSKEEARKKLAAVKKDLMGGEEKRGERKERGREEERVARYREIEREIYAAVKAGKLSKEEARKKLAAVKKDLMGGEEKRGERKERGREDERAAEYREIEREIHAAVKAGKMSKKDAAKKLEAIKRELFGGEKESKRRRGERERD